MKKTPAFSTSLRDLLTTLCARDALLKLARQFKALERLRDVHPADLCEALVGSGFGDEKRTIASARRLHGEISGHTVEEGAFYKHFQPGLVKLLRHLFQEAIRQAPPQRREHLMAAFTQAGIADVLGVDATQVLLPAGAAERWPSTDAEHGGIKLTTTLSLLFQRVAKVAITDAKTHDRKAFTLEKDLRGLLLVFDRGYSDHRLFADIQRRHGFFLTRLKKSSVPTISAIRGGLGAAHVGEKLDGDLPYRGVVDLDAEFCIRGKKTCTFWVIRVPVDKPTRGGGHERVDIWLVTNLSPEHFSPEQIAIIYRLRWAVEKLFHVLKSVGRLDQLHSINTDVIHAFLYATLLGIVLAQDVCELMRQARPGCEPSFHRVAIILTARLPRVLAALDEEDRLMRLLASLEQALWREGLNPNPGRPYSLVDQLDLLPHAA